MLRGSAGKVVAVPVVVLLVAGAVGRALLVQASAAPREAEYVGTGKCRMCHLEEHKTYSKTKHSTTFETLVGPEREKPDCVKCHVTGYGEPGGFVDLETTPKMVNVGCESCHGPGSAHLAAASKNLGKTEGWDKKIDGTPQNACTQCHNPHVRQGERAMKLREERGA